MDGQDQTKKRSPWVAIVAILAVVGVVATAGAVWSGSERLDDAGVVVCVCFFFTWVWFGLSRQDKATD